jgi:hypothetical protein
LISAIEKKTKNKKMAVPFNIPNSDEEESSSSSAQNVTLRNSAPVTPTRPISIPAHNNSSQSQQQQQQHSPLDNEQLVQAFYEALCRCSQISSTPSSSPSQTHFWYPQQHSPSQSNASSPRNSFRSGHRRRLNSYGSQSQYSQYSEDFEQDIGQWEQHYQQREHMDEFTGQVPKASSSSQKTDKKSKPKDQKSGKITNFVISALQFVIDTLK